MATPNQVVLLPGSLVIRSGVYRIAHSTDHLHEAECVLLKGMVLPSCHDGCDVTFTLVSPYVPEDSDFPKA